MKDKTSGPAVKAVIFHLFSTSGGCYLRTQPPSFLSHARAWGHQSFDGRENWVVARWHNFLPSNRPLSSFSYYWWFIWTRVLELATNREKENGRWRIQKLCRPLWRPLATRNIKNKRENYNYWAGSFILHFLLFWFLGQLLAQQLTSKETKKYKKMMMDASLTL